MEDRPLSLAVIDAFLLLELSDRTEIDAETARRAADTITASLRGLRHDDQVELREQLAEQAEESDDPDYRALVGSIADTVGLARPRPGEHLSWR